MKFIVAIVLPFIFYFGLGWIAKDIYFSMNPITDDTLFVDIYKNEILVYAVIAAVYNFFGTLHEDSVICTLVMVAIPIASYVLLAYVLPISEGAVYLNLILCVGSMIFTGLILC